MPVVALTAVLISSCTNTTSGEPSPAPTQTSGPSSGAATNSLASLKACSLVTDAEAQQVAPGSGAAVDKGQLGGSASDCQWTRAATNTVHAATWGVTIRPNQTIDQVNIGSGAATSGTVGTHQARQVKGGVGSGTCLLAVAVGGTGRVDFGVSAGLDSDEACNIAGKTADIVIPKLPA